MKTPENPMSKKKKQKGDDWFDDCSVCQAMRFAEKEGRMPTLPELREAFKKAKEQGAVVGGSFVEKKSNNNP